jgi:hypothetical protein
MRLLPVAIPGLKCVGVPQLAAVLFSEAGFFQQSASKLAHSKDCESQVSPAPCSAGLNIL